jgi:hypothetical protein
MTRRASRSPGLRARRSGAAARPADPLHALRSLEARRGTPAAERALEVWERGAADDAHAFAASAEALARGEDWQFSPDERRLLLGILAECSADPQLLPMLDTLADRLDAEAQSWPGGDDDELDEEALREASPAYRALSDAYEMVRTAQEALFLRDIGRADLARELLDDPAAWDRACGLGEASLLGAPRVVLSADDDPFGILLA